MPVTVRARGRATIPDTNAVNVTNDGAVKHDRNEDNNRDHDPGNVHIWSISDQPFREGLSR